MPQGFRHKEQVTSSETGAITQAAAANQASQRGEPSATARQQRLTWTQRLKRVFAIDFETCQQCGRRPRVIASIESPAVIDPILARLDRNTFSIDPAHPSRAPPKLDQLL